MPWTPRELCNCLSTWDISLFSHWLPMVWMCCRSLWRIVPHQSWTSFSGPSVRLMEIILIIEPQSEAVSDPAGRIPAGSLIVVTPVFCLPAANKHGLNIWGIFTWTEFCPFHLLNNSNPSTWSGVWLAFFSVYLCAFCGFQLLPYCKSIITPI